MARFEDLPLEILLLIVAHVLEPGTLASLCLVNQAFHDFAVSRLYNRISICPWHKSSKRRVIQLFRTLTKFPHLSRLVHQLALKEIRDFPKGPDFQDFGVHFWGRFPSGLENCVQLKVCTWTRDGSVTSDMLRSLAKCPELTDITINGAYSWDYQPVDLVQLLHLNKISLIMPSASVLEILPRWVQATGQSLTSLTLFCKEDIHVTDSLLRSVAQYVPQLECLHLVGCPRVTHKGVWSMIKKNVGIMKDISLETLSRTFDMLVLGEAAIQAGGLKSLLSFTLVTRRSSSWMNGTELLLRASPLELFQIYVPDSASERAPVDTFCDRIVEQHHDRLSRFSFYHPRPMSLHAIDNVCKHCPKLEELFVVIRPAEMARLIPILTQATYLRIVHVSIDEPLVNGLTYAQHIVDQCSPTIQQIGIRTEVWKVEKRVRTVEGVVQLDRCLIEIGISDIPERLLVSRT